jgi:hypothetical protein
MQEANLPEQGKRNTCHKAIHGCEDRPQASSKWRTDVPGIAQAVDFRIARATGVLGSSRSFVAVIILAESKRRKREVGTYIPGVAEFCHDNLMNLAGVHKINSGRICFDHRYEKHKDILLANANDDCDLLRISFVSDSKSRDMMARGNCS